MSEKSSNTVRKAKLLDSNGLDAKEIEVPEETFAARKEVTTKRKNSIGDVLVRKRSQGLQANALEKREPSKNMNVFRSVSSDAKLEKTVVKKEEKRRRKDPSERKSKRNGNKENEKKQEELEGEKDESSDSEVDEQDEEHSLEPRKNSITEILNRRSSIGIITTKKISQPNREEHVDNKLALPQSASSGNKVKYAEVGSQLHFHCSTGNWEIVKDLLDGTPEAIEHRSEDGRSILHISASLGHLHIVKGLLERDVDVNLTMNNGLTPLMLCVAQGKVDVVQVLLDFGASYCTQTSKDGYTALHLGCMHNQVKATKVLLSYIKEFGPKPSTKSASRKKVFDQISSGAMPLNDYLEVRSTKGYTAVHLVTVEGNLEMLKLLVSFGANVTATTHKGWVALHFAAHLGNEEICKYLLELDPSMVDCKNDAAEKPFDIAVFQKHDSLLEILTPKLKEKKKKRKKQKSTKSSNNNNNNNNDDEQKKEETIIIMPEFEGDKDECLIDRITKRPALLQEMKEDPNVFIKQIPPEGQQLLLNEAKQNPDLIEELLSIGREVLIDLIEKNPHLLLATVQSPISILRKAKTPAKLFKLLKQIEENPMMFMKDDCREDPELFFLQQLRDNVYLRYMVVQKLREKKPSLLPMIKIFIGIDASEISEPEEDKKMKTRMTNKLMKTTVSKYLKKMIENDGKDVNSNIINLDDSQKEGLQNLKDIMKEENVGKLMEKKGVNIKGPLFTMEEVPEMEELPIDDLD